VINQAYADLLNQGKYKVLLEKIIENGDIEELNSSLESNEVVRALSKDSGYFLNHAYRSKNLVIAKFLLSYGINFDIRHLAYLDKNTDKIGELLQHLHDIRPYLSSDKFNLAFNYIVTFYSNPLSMIAQKACYIAEDILMSLTYTNDVSKAHLIKEMYSNLYLDSTPIIHDIIEAIALINFKQPSLKIFITFGDSDAYLSSIQASDDKIYLPMNTLDQREQGLLMHEFTHYAEGALVKNQAKPYRNGDNKAMEIYHLIAKRVLAKIVPLFGEDKNKIITEQMIYDESVTLGDVCLKIAHAVKFHIFSFNGKQNSKEENDVLSQTFLNHTGTSDEHNSCFLRHYLDNIIKAYKFDNITVYYISRMADLCLRNSNELDHEFVAYNVELETYHNCSFTRPLSNFLHFDFTKMLDALKEKEGLSECPRTLTTVVNEPQPLSMSVDVAGEDMTYKNDTKCFNDMIITWNSTTTIVKSLTEIAGISKCINSHNITEWD
jgi:hypothetical protein